MMIHKLGLDNQSMLDGPIQEALYYTFQGVNSFSKNPMKCLKALNSTDPVVLNGV